MVPTVALPPATPPADQMAVAVIVLSPVIFAVNCCVPPGPAVMYPVGATVIVCALAMLPASAAAKQTKGARCLPILYVKKSSDGTCTRVLNCLPASSKWHNGTKYY